MKKIRIGMVCPYGWDTPGGVQTHIRDLTQHLIDEGHYVSVLAPISDDSISHEDYVVNAGKPISIPVNGSVARVIFGPIASSRAKQWVASGDFDLLHLHEPIVEKLTARIAVSELARSTLKDHFETDAVVIPNGIDGQKFSNAKVSEEFSGDYTVGFIGRFEEPRKGLQVLLDSLPIVARFIPNVRYLIAGPGESKDFLKEIDPQLRNRIKFLGRLTDEDKASFLKSIKIYVAPNTGGESFGIILTEALSAGTAVVASDIPAFKAVLENGEAGALFINEDSEDLAKTLVSMLKDDVKRNRLASNGKLSAQKYDWQVVAEQIESVYEMAIAGGQRVTLASENRFWNRK